MIKEERKRLKKREQIQVVVRCILITIIIICLVAVGIHLMKEKEADRVYENMQAESVVITADIEGAEKIEGKREWENVPEVDFETLWETNMDICAWIYVPGTQVNYPILRNNQAVDPYDDYYLQHTVDKKEGLPGAIYMEPCNMPDFSDKNTVLYGHHMKNGSMFASLDSYLNADFFEENAYVYIVTPEKNLVYQIFGAVIYDNRHIMRSYDFSDDVSYQLFLDSLVANESQADIIREDVEVTVQDRMITMSTCVKNQDDKRLLVEAVLVDEYER